MSETETRSSLVSRKTKETEVNVSLELDGNGIYWISTGLPFFDHLLQIFSKHSSFNLELTARGDLAVDGHHTVEDAGMCLGKALSRALGDKKGINRFGYAIVPLDDALVMAVVDLSGRSYLAFDAQMTSPRLGDFDTELVEEFLRAFVTNGEFNLHIRQLAGNNTHHIIEATFKAMALAMKQATAITGEGIPSTKGVL
ncbi:MAG TPA: imidazoleglycerol-phosphate dehydratase HisB [bacterium]|jgi:imidazoleglycerol-phosphate dehydratase|nr:imidazoleglycerol-phosphate dehydratase HisB [Peptococcaceae bacterium MAG4]NLW39014.1 imidazoleglycerol-phosphate dehydratase HisB [Peptococcaceae bacterium]HOL68160.1 imidazoleglycerol-phosphate dehydratase HisB [bacterium]HPZ43908.1 imidazoleglycerol-phosphate dehydratase HisB [Bacillota bacterium]HQD76263.1 imidazoleglycerol-phosphate dehydratase HisB [Bacillota bacterium]